MASLVLHDITSESRTINFDTDETLLEMASRIAVEHREGRAAWIASDDNESGTKVNVFRIPPEVVLTYKFDNTDARVLLTHLRSIELGETPTS
ncbi:MAG: hypothetical protein P1U38_09565 [Aeromicrobium sp.]|uniref:hypothetical protein n=1 Tax=Aeromicrobium sp. TaxID=1871063 RepID=UPI00261F7FA3|nr:hypothetical protein [Aeromicrobium sp.]MDF1705008.1 hypothetical protein [Aeromicrobium sp.]